MKIIFFKFIIILIIQVSFTLSCIGKESVPSGNIYNGKISFEFAIYFLNSTGEKTEKFLNIILKNKFKIFTLITDKNKSISTPHIKIREIKNVQKEYTPPSINDLKYFGHGLSKKHKALLQKSNYVLVLDFYCLKKDIWLVVKKAYQLMYDLAEFSNSLLWDEETREIFTSHYWKTKRIATWKEQIPNLSKHFVIHFYRDDEYCRAITLGMSKFGLPDVLINNLSCYQDSSTQSLINLTCQTLAEKGFLKKAGNLEVSIDEIKNSDLRKVLLNSLLKGAEKKSKLNIIIGKREEGDPENRILEVNFGSFWGDSPHVERNATISKIFGSEDSIVNINHDKKILEASKKAKLKIPYLKNSFIKGLKPGEHILVKLPFKTPDGSNEWMWVEITSWENNKINGILQNDPFKIPNLKAGSKVYADEKDIFDYIHYFPDGKQEGNETGKIIGKQKNKE